MLASVGARPVLLAGIGFYQRRLSRWKGFSCAHRVLHGDVSCSHAVKAIVLEQPPEAWGRLTLERFRACRDAARVLRAEGEAQEGERATLRPGKQVPSSGWQGAADVCEALYCLGEIGACLAF
jgi:hypothetical protein